MTATDDDRRFMQRALELARRGEGYVEPNPLVGCVLVRGGRIIGEGWHQRFGGPHAEVEALAVAGEQARGATAYVTLEPCCHHGKTPPCTEALIAAGVARIVVGVEDPNPQVAGRGLARLSGVGIEAGVGVCSEDAAALIAPFRKLMTTGRPWVIAKWAMTLDGKIAAVDGSSQWITGEAARAEVHKLRGRVDAIVVGRGTAQRDDPLLTARPAGPRVPARIVLDGGASLALDSNLATSVGEGPVIVAAAASAPLERVDALRKAGVETLLLASSSRAARWDELLAELGRRQMTNVLVEGGGETFGELLAAGALDEVFAFIAPKLLGGSAAPGPIGGPGQPSIAEAIALESLESIPLGPDLLVRGRLTIRDSASRRR